MAFPSLPSQFAASLQQAQGGSARYQRTGDLNALNVVVYRLVLPVALAYADLVESAFALYRCQLYTAVGWPPPRAGREESATGQRLTEFLWRGTLPDSIPKAPPGS